MSFVTATRHHPTDPMHSDIGLPMTEVTFHVFRTTVAWVVQGWMVSEHNFSTSFHWQGLPEEWLDVRNVQLLDHADLHIQRYCRLRNLPNPPP